MVQSRSGFLENITEDLKCGWSDINYLSVSTPLGHGSKQPIKVHTRERVAVIAEDQLIDIPFRIRRRFRVDHYVKNTYQVIRTLLCVQCINRSSPLLPNIESALARQVEEGKVATSWIVLVLSIIFLLPGIVNRSICHSKWQSFRPFMSP